MSASTASASGAQADPARLGSAGRRCGSSLGSWASSWPPISGANCSVASQYSPLVDGWLVAGFELVASGLCLARGLVRRPGRAVALVLGAGLLCWSAGDVAITIESLGGATPSAPSPADAFYLAFFPIAYVAVVLFMRGGTRRLSTPSWLDGAVAGLGAAAVCAAFAFSSLRTLTGGRTLAVATNLAYPIGDLLLLFLVVGGTAMLSGRRRAPWLLLAAGAAVNIAGDTANLLGSSLGAAHVGAVADAAAWPTSILLMSMAVWLPAGRADPFAAQKPSGLVLPGLAAGAGLAILVIGIAEPREPRGDRPRHRHADRRRSSPGAVGTRNAGPAAVTATSSR